MERLVMGLGLLQQHGQWLIDVKWCVFLLIGLVCVATAHADLKELDVRQYGALGDGKTDDGPAFRRAMEALKPNQTLRIPAGQYRLMPEKTWDQQNDPGHAPDILPVEHLKNNIIAGEPGTHLIMGVPANGFMIRQCEGLTIRQVTIDYQPLNFTQGTVVSADPANANFVVRIDPGYADPIKPVFAGMLHAVFMAPATRKWDHTLGEAYVTDVQPLANGLFRLDTRNDYSDQIPGSKFVVATRRQAEAFRITGSRDCLFEDITIYSAPGCGFLSWSCDGVTLRRCTIQIKPETDRMYTTSADGFHCKVTRHVLMEDCQFTGMGDDAANIAGGYGRVCEQISDTQLIVDRDFVEAQKGDTVEFFDLTSACVLATRHVIESQSIKWRGMRALQLTLDQPYQASATVDSTKTKVIRFRSSLEWMRYLKKLPVKPVMIATLENSGMGAVVRNCYFHNFRGRGIMLRAPQATVENCVFEHLAGPGIVLGHDFSWGEGYNGRGARILNNTFKDIRRSNIILVDANLLLHAMPKEVSSTMTWGYSIDQVTIEGNRFEGFGTDTWSYGRGIIGNVIYLADCQNVVVNDNTFGPAVSDPVKAPTIYIGVSKNIQIQNNKMELPNPTCQVEDGVAKDTLKIQPMSSF
jgi:hypothetical protein